MSSLTSHIVEQALAVNPPKQLGNLRFFRSTLAKLGLTDYTVSKETYAALEEMLEYRETSFTQSYRGEPNPVTVAKFEDLLTKIDPNNFELLYLVEEYYSRSYYYGLFNAWAAVRPEHSFYSLGLLTRCLLHKIAIPEKFLLVDEPTKVTGDQIPDQAFSYFQQTCLLLNKPKLYKQVTGEDLKTTKSLVLDTYWSFAEQYPAVCAKLLASVKLKPQVSWFKCYPNPYDHVNFMVKDKMRYLSIAVLPKLLPELVLKAVLSQTLSFSFPTILGKYNDNPEEASAKVVQLMFSNCGKLGTFESDEILVHKHFKKLSLAEREQAVLQGFQLALKEGKDVLDRFAPDQLLRICNVTQVSAQMIIDYLIKNGKAAVTPSTINSIGEHSLVIDGSNLLYFTLYGSTLLVKCALNPESLKTLVLDYKNVGSFVFTNMLGYSHHHTVLQYEQDFTNYCAAIPELVEAFSTSERLALAGIMASITANKSKA